MKDQLKRATDSLNNDHKLGRCEKVDIVSEKENLLLVSRHMPNAYRELGM
jgi:hypothetical protein